MNIDALPGLRCRLRWLGTPWRPTVLEREATHVEVQTVQHEAVWADLVRTGVHRPPRWGDDHDFAEPYEWMAQQMAERLFTDGDGMVWAWAQHRRSDLKSVGLSGGEVLLRCLIPRERVLVSHFGDWHCVLNGMLFVEPLPGDDAESYGKRSGPLLDAFFDRLDAEALERSAVRNWPPDLRQEIESSWEAIFDARHWTGRDVLQATVHELRASDVVEAFRFR